MTEDTKQIYQSMLAVKSEIEPIAKDQKGYNYRYRGVDRVMRELHELHVKHGILTHSEVKTDPNRIIWVLTALDGSSFQIEMPYVLEVEYRKSLSKSITTYQDIGKVMAYTYKTAMFYAYEIPTEDAANSDPDSIQHAYRRENQDKVVETDKIRWINEIRKASPNLTDKDVNYVYASMKHESEKRGHDIQQLVDGASNLGDIIDYFLEKRS